MNNLIAEFKSEHIRILDTLSSVIELGVTSEEGQRLICSARVELLNHLQKEDNILYPELERAAGKDQRLKQILFTFSHNIGDITRIATKFFDKYSSGSEGKELQIGFDDFVALLINRLREEEKVLFPEFEKIHERQIEI